MTNTPQDPLDRLAAIVERFINASSTRQDQLEAAQLRFQEQLGDLARMIARHEQEIREIRQRQAESDQRFDVMLQEIRFLIRQQRSTENESDAGSGT